jgi:hypothetical protein
MSTPEILGIALGGGALVLPVLLELLRRPRLEIKPERWGPVGQHAWTFAVVHVRNKPLPGWVPLARMSAEGCRATVEFRKFGDDSLAIPEVSARWSSQPQPIKRTLVEPPADLRPQLPAGAAFVEEHFDPQMVPQTLTLNVPASARWEEVAVAILLADGEAYAWAAESYAYAGWRNPRWLLDRGVYDVTVRPAASTTSRFGSKRLALARLRGSNLTTSRLTSPGSRRVRRRCRMGVDGGPGRIVQSVTPLPSRS